MNPKRLSTILILLVLLLAASACAAKKENPVNRVAGQPVKSTQVAYATQAVGKSGMAPANPPAQVPPSTNQTQAQSTATAGDTSMLDYLTGSVRMVIKDDELELLVEDTDRAIDQVTQLTSDYGGYLISSQSWYDGEFKYAAIRLAVPSAAFETALTTLRHIGLQVTRETGSGQDVSAEYTDLQSRLTNLEATAARVRDFLNAAQTVDESLRVNQQLSDLEGQIEQVKGQMKYYEGRSAFSTITVNLTPQRPTPTHAPTATPTATPTPTPGWNPVHTFNNASGILSALFRATVDLLIWLGVVFGPFVLVFALIFWLLDRFLHLRSRLQINRPLAARQASAPAHPSDQTPEQ